MNRPGIFFAFFLFIAFSCNTNIENKDSRSGVAVTDSQGLDTLNIKISPPPQAIDREDRIKPEIIRNKQGQIIERRSWHYLRDGKAAAYDIIKYTFDEQGNRLSDKLMHYTPSGVFKSQNITEYLYNDKGQRICYIFNSWDSKMNLVNKSFNCFTYYENGLEKEAIFLDADSLMLSKTLRHYDDNGILAREDFFTYDKGVSPDVKSLFYNKQGAVIREE